MATDVAFVNDWMDSREPQSTTVCMTFWVQHCGSSDIPKAVIVHIRRLSRTRTCLWLHTCECSFSNIILRASALSRVNREPRLLELHPDSIHSVLSVVQNCGNALTGLLIAVYLLGISMCCIEFIVVIFGCNVWCVLLALILSMLRIYSVWMFLGHEITEIIIL